MPTTPPEPPYWAVIFTSRLSADTDGYAETARHMVELARAQPGFLGVDSARGPDGLGVTVSYWKSEAAIAAWKAETEHTQARRLGRERWYADFTLHVAKVERSYGKG